MEIRPSVLDRLYVAYGAETLGEAPQLHDCHLDQALLVLSLAIKRAQRSAKLRQPRTSACREQYLPF